MEAEGMREETPLGGGMQGAGIQIGAMPASRSVSKDDLLERWSQATGSDESDSDGPGSQGHYLRGSGREEPLDSTGEDSTELADINSASQ